MPTEGDAVEVIDVSAHEPRRIPSKKWRELIKKVWEADPLRCPKCSREMRIVSLIDGFALASPHPIILTSMGDSNPKRSGVERREFHGRGS